jgi:hypothetical protein
LLVHRDLVLNNFDRPILLSPVTAVWILHLLRLIFQGGDESSQLELSRRVSLEVGLQGGLVLVGVCQPQLCNVEVHVELVRDLLTVEKAFMDSLSTNTHVFLGVYLLCEFTCFRIYLYCFIEHCL